MSPKKLLKYKGAVSPLIEFQESYRFRRVLLESHQKDLVQPQQIKKVVFCTGQVYYDLLETRKKKEY